MPDRVDLLLLSEVAGSTNHREAQLKFPANQRLWRLVLAATFIPLAFIAFWPTPIDRPVSGQLACLLQFLYRHGAPKWFDYNFVEAIANMALFVPIGSVSTFAFPKRRVWQLIAFSLLISLSIELGQLLFLHNRFASLSDIVLNTTGALVGVLLAKLRPRPSTT